MPVAELTTHNLKSRLLSTIVSLRDALRLLNMRLTFRPLRPGDDPNLIVSLTSFPARIDHAWMAIESLFRQDLSPAKIVLVLSEEEFPDRRLPRTIRRQMRRGLEILWTPRDIRSYKKLLPVRNRYPEATIVTFDDDLTYEPWRLRRLVDAAHQHPGTMIGHRGWEVAVRDGSFMPYIEWGAAGPDTPSGQCFLTSGAGMLFPPGVLDDSLLLDADLAMHLCPTADDVWFWALAQKAGVRQQCLGNHGLTYVRPLDEGPKMEDINRYGGQNDVQIRAVTEYFALRQRMVESTVDR